MPPVVKGLLALMNECKETKGAALAACLYWLASQLPLRAVWGLGGKRISPSAVKLLFS